MHLKSLVSVGAFLLTAAAFSQTPPAAAPPADDADWIRKPATLKLSGEDVAYQTTVGKMPIRNNHGEIEGRIFFTAYKRTNADATKKRPVTFVFNGGPGSASLWLHLGFAGPKRVVVQPDGFMPPPPYEMATNNESLLPDTDLVFIDPVGTGYSRPERPELGSKFWGVSEDVHSVGEFIRMYLTMEKRWLSPVFVMGESYGGMRGSGLARWLGSNGIGLNGLILVSPYINDSIQGPAKGNDMPLAFNLPTYAATAWYHKKLSPDLQKKPVDALVKEVSAWVYDEYLPGLIRGSALSPAGYKSILTKLHRYTGLSETYLNDANLRISDWNWYKELLRADRYTVGRYDARFKGLDRNWATDHPDYDPSYSQVAGPFTSTMNDYVRNELGFVTTQKYFVLGEGLEGPWRNGEGPVDQSESLRAALTENPYTKLFVAMGYYDLACPMGTVDQILNQLELDPRLKSNVTRAYYPAGHMMYLDEGSRVKLAKEVREFIRSSAAPTAPAGTIK